jgi:hypothetical protein
LNELPAFFQNAISKLEELSLKKVDEIDINYIKLFPTTVKEYLQQICQFSTIRQSFESAYENFKEIMDSLNNLSANIPADTFIDVFYSIKQQIINSLPNDITKDNLDKNIIVFFSVMISLKNKYSLGRFNNLFTEIITKNGLGDPDIERYIQEISKNIIKIGTFSEENILNAPNEIIPEKNKKIWEQYRSQIITTISGLDSPIDEKILVPYKFLIDIELGLKGPTDYAFDGGKKNKKKTKKVKNSKKKHNKTNKKKHSKKINKIKQNKTK